MNKKIKPKYKINDTVIIDDDFESNGDYRAQVIGKIETIIIYNNAQDKPKGCYYNINGYSLANIPESEVKLFKE